MLSLFVLSAFTATLPSRTSLTWPSSPPKLLARNLHSPHFLLLSLPLQSLVPLMVAVRADPSIHCLHPKHLLHPCHHYWPLSCGTAEMHHHSINFCCRVVGWSVIWVKGITTRKGEEKQQDYPFLLAPTHHLWASFFFLPHFPTKDHLIITSPQAISISRVVTALLSVKRTGISSPSTP